MRYQTDLIKKPKPGDDRYFGDVNTKGIIEVVLYADPKSGEYTTAFAKTLKHARLIDTCKSIWNFLKTQIPYVLDKTGYQWIKSPGRLWEEKAGDCKSFSVMTASILKNLGISYGYRFASYDKDDPTPTHVYIYVPVSGGKEIIIDAVWSGPFNTQKQYTHKQDYLMAKTSYLGTTGQHKPGELKITTPIEELTDGELDLLLLKQNLEIKKMNAGIAGIGAYDEAIRTVDHCIRNVGNPDVIIGIGEALEEGYSFKDAVGGIGLLKSKRRKEIEKDLKQKGLSKKEVKKESKAQLKKETGKTGAGRLLQKVGKGLKNAGKAVLKVVTLPMRLVAKGAMEIYLPKAAPFFLYLFAPNPDTLPDMMKRKRAKAEKFKNFVVKGLGMKEAHFMKIVGNGLEKRYKKPPAQYLAEKLANRVSGIGNPKLRWRRECDRVIAGISGPDKPKRKQVKKKPKNLRPNAKPNYNSTLQSNLNDARANSPAANFDFSSGQRMVVPYNGNEDSGGGGLSNLMDNASDIKNVVDNFSSGNIAGGIIAALSWLIQKITALFGGKEKMDPIGINDLPDVERDAANAFSYGDLTQDYSNLTYQQKQELKYFASDAIADQKINAWEKLNQNFNYLNPDQRNEIYEEIQEGPEALDEYEGRRLASDIDDGQGNNNTGLIVLAALAAIAIAK